MQNSNSKRTTSALIVRPQSNAAPTSTLGNAVNGALMGMGRNQVHPFQQGWPVPGVAGPPPNTYGQPLLPYNHMGTFPTPQHQLPFYPTPNQHFSPNVHQMPAQPLPPSYPYLSPQQNSTQYPAQYFSQSHLTLQPQYHPVPTSFYSNPSTPSDFPSHIRTNAEGYGISPSYVEPIILPRPVPSDRPSRGRGGGGRGRGKSNSNGPSNRNDSTTVSLPPVVHQPIVNTCSLEGCSFEGSLKLVRQHEEDRHLIFAPGREPKPWVPSFKGSTPIEGSNISLDSPEAIAKWIEDRKKRWPSTKVMEDKEKQRMERVAAGLESEFPTRGGRGRGRGRGERGGRGSDRGRGGRGGSSFGRGRERDDDMDNERESKRAKQESSSSELDEDDDDDGPPIASTSKLPVPTVEFIATKSVGLQIHASRLAQTNGEEIAEPETSSIKSIQVVCKHWRKGNCGLGKDCPFLHELPNRTGPSSLPPRRRPAPPSAPHNPFARADPFSQLAERDISHLTAELMQVIDFLAKNQWLKGVETRAGMVEDGVGTSGIIEVEAPIIAEVRDDDPWEEASDADGNDEEKIIHDDEDSSSNDEDEDAAEDAALIEALTKRIASASQPLSIEEEEAGLNAE